MSAQTAKPLRLARASRVTQNRDFVRIRQQGERLAQGCLVANWNKLPEGAAPRLGVVTSRKIGGAVIFCAAMAGGKAGSGSSRRCAPWSNIAA